MRRQSAANAAVTQLVLIRCSLMLLLQTFSRSGLIEKIDPVQRVFLVDASSAVKTSVVLVARGSFK